MKDVRLLEVSLVSMPMNPQAKLIDVKGVAASEKRDRLRKVSESEGFANTLARRLATGWNAAVGRGDDAEEFLKQIRAHTSGINGA